MSAPIFTRTLLIGLFLFTFFSLQSQIYVNEWMSKNTSTYNDSAGEYDDWIEIYNSSTEAIDLANYYFTDQPSIPTLWRIPSGQPDLTTVPAGGFLILWADKDLDQGANHLDFKLSSSGDTIAIFQDNGSEIIPVNMVIFGELPNDVSMGRVFDGQAEIAVLPAPTPDESNGSFVLPTTYTASISSAIIDPNDDVEETSYGGMIMDSYHLELVDDWANQLVGLRFQGLNIPQGATILSAYIQFAVDTEHIGTCDLFLQCENADDAAHFSESDENVSGRNRTAASIVWQPEDWVAEWVADEAQKTPNLAPIVEEVVQRAGWNSGNDMVFMVSGSGVREAVAFEYKPERAAKLYITYENTIASSPVSGLKINELAANGSDYLNASDDYSDWIELYNESGSVQDIQGLFLSDNPNNLLKWAINKPVSIGSQDFVIVNADEDTEKEEGLHANFKLGKNGETVFLSQVLNNEIVLLDSITYPAMPFKATYGREFDGSDNWILFGKTTPKASNLEGLSYLAPAAISPPSGIFTGLVSNITLSHPDPNVTLRYTTDGSIPSSSDDIYQNPFSVSENSIVRVKAFKNGHENLEVPLATYLINTDHDLPILTISTDPDNFFSDETGIYVEGENGSIFGFCGDDETPSNFINDWERPVSIAMYEPDGVKAFEVNAGIKIAGACSRYQDLKSMNVYLRPNQYGDDKIDYQIFPDRDRDNFKRLKIRNSGQDFQNSMMRDGTLHNITGEILDMDYQAYRPAVVYINGEYWGIMNMRELYGGKYFDEHHDISEDDIDLIKNPRLGNEVKEGDDVAYSYIFNFAEFNDLSEPDNYNYIAERIDIDNFINYWATMVYLSCSDWPANNLMVWRKHEDGKFRWVIIDTDASTSAYGIQGNTSYIYDMLDKVTRADAMGWPNDAKSTLLFRKLLENESFRNEYIQRSCSIMDIVYSPERTAEYIDASAARINTEIPDHIDRWIDDLPYLQTHTKWTSRVARLKEFFELRPDYWIEILNDHFGISNTFELTFNYDESTPGNVFVNNNQIPVPFNHVNTYYENIPITVSVEPDEGYQFLYWLETGETEMEITYESNMNSTLTPVFLESAISAQISGSQGVCLGETADLSVSLQNCQDCTVEWQDGFVGEERTVLPFTNTTYSISVSNEDNTASTETSFELEVYSLPLVSLDAQNASCFGENDAQISVTPFVGAIPFTYEWNIGEDGNSIQNLAPGTYSVTFVDAHGCTSSQTIPVSQPQILEAESIVSNISCPEGNEGEIIVEVIGGTTPYNYYWSHNDEDSPEQEDLAAGTYLVEITDANNCVLELNSTIESPEEFNANATSTDVLCHGDESGSISLNATGGTAPYTYAWNIGSSETELESLEAGSYTLTVLDDNNCLFYDEITINSPELLTSEVSTVNLLCAGDDNGEIDLTLEGGTSPYLFEWNNEETSEDLEGLIAGEYFVTVTDENDCVLEFGATISEPDAIDLVPMTTNISCHGEENGAIDLSVNGGTAPYEIAWGSGEDTTALANLGEGIYTAMVLDINGCETSLEVVLEEPDSLEISFTDVDPICFGTNEGQATVEIEGGTGDYDIEWSNEEDLATISNLAAGIYFATVTDESLCVATDSIEILEQPEISLISETVDNNCYGEEEGIISVITVGGLAPFEFLWSNGDNTAGIMNLESGTYNLTTTDANGCIVEGEYEVLTPELILVEPFIQLPNLGIDGSINLEIDGGVEPYSFEWDNGSTDQNQTGLDYGLYTVTVTDANNCHLVEVYNLGTSSISDLLAVKSFSISPNPNNGNFVVNADFENSIKGELRIVNTLGQLIKKEKFSGFELRKEFALNNLESGIYWLQIYSDRGVQTKKFVVEY